MTINHSDGRSFNVRFFSRMVENSVGKIVRETTCKLATVDETKVGRERYNNVAIGTVRQNGKEADSRPQGQKYAFGEAIKAFPKEERVKMWRQYDPTMKIEGTVS